MATQGRLFAQPGLFAGTLCFLLLPLNPVFFALSQLLLPVPLKLTAALTARFQGVLATITFIILGFLSGFSPVAFSFLGTELSGLLIDASSVARTTTVSQLTLNAVFLVVAEVFSPFESTLLAFTLVVFALELSSRPSWAAGTCVKESLLLLGIWRKMLVMAMTF